MCISSCFIFLTRRNGSSLDSRVAKLHACGSTLFDSNRCHNGLAVKGAHAAIDGRDSEWVRTPLQAITLPTPLRCPFVQLERIKTPQSCIARTTVVEFKLEQNYTTFHSGISTVMGFEQNSTSINRGKGVNCMECTMYGTTPGKVRQIISFKFLQKNLTKIKN